VCGCGGSIPSPASSHAHTTPLAFSRALLRGHLRLAEVPCATANVRRSGRAGLLEPAHAPTSSATPLAPPGGSSEPPRTVPPSPSPSPSHHGPGPALALPPSSKAWVAPGTGVDGESTARSWRPASSGTFGAAGEGPTAGPGLGLDAHADPLGALCPRGRTLMLAAMKLAVVATQVGGCGGLPVWGGCPLWAPTHLGLDDADLEVLVRMGHASPAAVFGDTCPGPLLTPASIQALRSLAAGADACAPPLTRTPCVCGCL
jgi:hypothetical protein